MVLVDATAQVEKIRAAVRNDSYAVQSMPPPSYFSSLVCAGTSADIRENIILVYKLGSSGSASSLPIASQSDLNSTSVQDLDLTGQPLECPFDDDKFEDTIFIDEKYHPWSQAELSQLPLPIKDARMLLNRVYKEQTVLETDGEPLLDVWLLTSKEVKIVDGMSPKGTSCKKLEHSVSDSPNGEKLEMSQNGVQQADICTPVLLGVHMTNDERWERSIVYAQDWCSLEAPEMDPQVMKQNHLEVSKLPVSLMKSEVICRYNVASQHMISDQTFNFSSLSSASSVSLELEWQKLSKTIPFEEAITSVLTHVIVGTDSSPANGLWLQLKLLQELLDVLLVCWRDKTAPQTLPHAQPASNSEGSPVSVEPLKDRLQVLMRRGGMALQANGVEARMSLAPSLLDGHSVDRRKSIAPGFLGRHSVAPGRFSVAPKVTGMGKESERSSRSLIQALKSTIAASRENADTTDSLWILLSECKTYDELTQMWDLIFHEVSRGSCKPFLRPKNSTRAAKLIQKLVSSEIDYENEIWQFAALQPLELLVEIGLEKLSADFYYIFLDSELVGRNTLQAPQMPRSGPGVSRDMWLSRCGQLLGWLAQVHTALEVLLPLQASLPPPTLSTIAPEAVSYFQSKLSPVRSVTGLSSGLGRVHDYRCQVKTRDVQNLLTNHFDWWRLTLTSETETRRVKSVFLRNRLNPIFPPTLSPSQAPVVSGEDDVQYCCAEMVTISESV